MFQQTKPEPPAPPLCPACDGKGVFVVRQRDTDEPVTVVCGKCLGVPMDPLPSNAGDDDTPPEPVPPGLATRGNLLAAIVLENKRLRAQVVSLQHRLARVRHFKSEWTQAVSRLIDAARQWARATRPSRTNENCGCPGCQLHAALVRVIGGEEP